MLPRIWVKSSLCCIFLLPLSWIYGLISVLNRFSYRCGLRKTYKYTVPIIVVGNITIGGNGKTPIVLWLTEQLKHRGWKVGIISRGYKGKSDHYPIILDDNSYSNECGDEPILIWKRTQVPVAVSPRRTDAVSALLKMKSLDIVISDDGLQHYALYRDIEWVVVSDIIQFGNGFWIPAGPMRDRVSRLNTVQAIIINGLEQTKINPGEILMQLHPSKIINLVTRERRSLASFSSNIIVAMAGIGCPVQFFAILKNHGLILDRMISFSDHHVYTEKMLIDLVKENEILLMTEKDAVKCLDFAHLNWWYVHVDVKINDLDTQYLLCMVEDKIRLYKAKSRDVMNN